MLSATDYDVWLLLNVLAGDRVLFKYNRRDYNALQGGLVVVPSFLKACDVLLGIPEALSDLSSPDKGTGNLNLFISQSSLIVTTFCCLQEVHGKDDFLQAIQVLAPQFRFFLFFSS